MTGGASPRRRGDYFERQTRDDLTRHGWLVVRCPGSGSGSEGTPLEGTGVDLLAIRRGHRPLLISCKLSGRVPKAEMATLVRVAKRYGATPLLALRVGPGLIGYTRARGEQWTHGDETAED